MRATFIVDDFVIDPLGIGYLSSYLKAAGHSVDLVKTNDPALAEVVSDPPNMLCYSVTTGKHGYYLGINKLIRQSLNGRCFSVFGGAHVTFFPDFCKEDYVDFGVRGEGFDAVADLAEAIEFRDSVSRIPNVVHRGRMNPLRPLRRKDTLLQPDRELIYKYRKNFMNPIKNVMCSFGCIYSCPYCYSSGYRQLYGLKGAEVRPVPSIMEEIRHLAEYPLELIFFQDDVFPLYRREWLEQFVLEYRNIGLPFHIQVRPEFISDDAIRQLKGAGLHGVTFAIESGSQRLRWNVLNRRMKNEMIVEAANTVHAHGVKLRTENMVGIPEETWQTAMETLELNQACEPTIAWASLFQPYPGTELGDRCAADGTFDGDLDHVSESFFDTYRLRVGNAKKYEKLQKIFSFLVKHPRLRVFTKLLCSLPFGYKRFYRWYKKRLYGQLYKV